MWECVLWPVPGFGMVGEGENRETQIRKEQITK